MVVEVIRYGGLGDELCLTPSYRALKLQDPTSQIIVRGTSAPDILHYNTNVDGAFSSSSPVVDTDVVHDIKWHTDTKDGYDMHLVDYYAEQMGVEVDSHLLDLELGDEDREWGEWVEEMPRPIIFYDVYSGWRTKGVLNLDILRSLDSRGYTMIQVGRNSPYTGVGYNMVGRTPTVRKLGAILQRGDLYLGNDSGSFHVASAVGSKCMILFGSTNPNSYIHNTTKEMAIYNSECHGCYNRGDTSVIGGGCSRGDSICMKLDTDVVINAVGMMIGG